MGRAPGAECQGAMAAGACRCGAPCKAPSVREAGVGLWACWFILQDSPRQDAEHCAQLGPRRWAGSREGYPGSSSPPLGAASSQGPLWGLAAELCPLPRLRTQLWAEFSDCGSAAPEAPLSFVGLGGPWRARRVSSSFHPPLLLEGSSCSAFGRCQGIPPGPWALRLLRESHD